MPKDLYLNIKLRGCSSPNKEELIALQQHGQEWFATRRAFLTNLPGTLATLAEQGLAIGGRGYAAQIGEQIGEIDRFPEEEVLEQAGWNGPLFARPDGIVLAPKNTAGTKESGIAYYRFTDRYSRAGKSSDWKRKIAPALGRSDVATFLACIALTPVVRGLLTQAVGPASFDVVALQRSGAVRRTTLSVAGSMASNQLSHDPLERVLAYPTRYIDGSRDGLMVLGDLEGYLHGGSDKKRLAAVRALLFDYLIPNGTSDANASGSPAPAFVTVESRPLADVLGLDAGATERLQAQVPTVYVPGGMSDHQDDRGVLAGLPKRQWGNVVDEMVSCYGHGLYAFQRKLVERRAAKGLSKVQAELDSSFDQFCRSAQKHYADEQLPDQQVHAFALAHAAFQMAWRLGVLHWQGQAILPVWSVFKRFVAQRPRPVTAASILVEVADRPGVRAVSDIGVETGRAELEDVPAFLHVPKDGTRELWVLTAQKKNTFDWPFFSKLPDFERWYRGRGEKDRHGTKKAIGAWKNARVLRFCLP